LGPVTVPSVEYLDLQFTNVRFGTRGVLLAGNFTHSNIIFTNCTLDAAQYLISALGDIVNSTITIRNSTLSYSGDVDAVIGLYTQRAFNSSVLRVVDSTVKYAGTSVSRSISMILARMDMRDSVVEVLRSRVTNNCSGSGLTCLAVYFSTSTIENSAIRVADSTTSVTCSTCAGYNVLFQATPLRNSSFIVENSYLNVNSMQNTAYSLLFYGGSTLTQSAVSIRNSTCIASGLTAWNYYAVTSSGMFEGSQLLFENVNATATGTIAAANIVSFTDSPTDRSRVNVTGSSLISYGDIALALFRFVVSGLVNGSEYLVQDTTIVSSSNGTAAYGALFDTSSGFSGSAMRFERCRMVVTGTSYSAGLKFNLNSGLRDGSVLTVSNSELLSRGGVYVLAFAFTNNSGLTGSSMVVANSTLTQIGTATPPGYARTMEVTEGSGFTDADMTWENVTAFALCETACPARNLVLQYSPVTSSRLLFRRCRLTAIAIDSVINLLANHSSFVNVTLEITDVYLNATERGVATTSNVMLQEVILLQSRVILNRSTAIVFGSSPTTQMNVGLQKVACMNSSVLVHATMMIAEAPVAAASNICIYSGTNITGGSQLSVTNTTARSLGKMHGRFFQVSDSTPVDGQSSVLLRDVEAEIIVTNAGFSTAAAVLFQTLSPMVNATLDIMRSRFVASAPSDSAYGVVFYTDCSLTNGSRVTISQTSMVLNGTYARAVTVQRSAIEFGSTLIIRDSTAVVTGDALAAGVALVSATVTDQGTILLDNTTFTVTSRGVGYGVQFDGGSLQRGARLILRGGAIIVMAGTAAAVRFDSAARIDSTNITVVRSTWLLTGSQTVAGVSLSNADFLASTLTVSQSNMSLYGGNSSYLLQQSGATTRIDQSSIMIADSTMTIIGVMNASATVFLTGSVNESSVVVQSCHITTTAATLGTLFTLQSPSTLGIMGSNITAEGVEFDCTGGSCAALSASGYAAPRPISRTAITFTRVTLRTNASVSATVIDLIDSTFTDGTLVQVHDAAIRNSAANGTATFLKGTAASVISAAASVNVTDTTVQLDGNTSALLSFDGLMNTAAAFSVARMHIGMTTTGSGHLLRGSRLIGNASVRLVDVRAECIARDDAFCGVWWVAVSGEASNGTASLLRVRMSGFTTSASAMAEQALICSLECSFLNGKLLQVADGRAVCDPTTSTASSVHAECASQTGSSSISDTLSASHVSATMSGETASPSRTTPTHTPADFKPDSHFEPNDVAESLREFQPHDANTRADFKPDSHFEPNDVTESLGRRGLVLGRGSNAFHDIIRGAPADPHSDGDRAAAGGAAGARHRVRGHRPYRDRRDDGHLRAREPRPGIAGVAGKPRAAHRGLQGRRGAAAGVRGEPDGAGDRLHSTQQRPAAVDRAARGWCAGQQPHRGGLHLRGVAAGSG
jgi:hypothetical protein